VIFSQSAIAAQLPRDRLQALETLGKHLGLGDKAQGQQIGMLSAALIAIRKQGSAAPIATARDCGMEH
jgi:hypothetical protein